MKASSVLSRSALRELLVPVLAVFTALVVGAVLIRLSGASVLDAYLGLLEGMLGSPDALAETLIASVPYMLAGLSVAMGFKAGLFNIGAEGQFYMGALFATLAGFLLDLPPALHVPICVLAGAVGGGLWGMIPGLLKARLGAHEVITTIMLNYIGVQFVAFMVKEVMRDPSSTVDRTPFIHESAHLPMLLGGDLRLHAGILMALGMIGLMWWFVNRTTFGFAIRMTGANPGAARYAGVRVDVLLVGTMSLAGALAGLAGTTEVLGLTHTLPAQFSSGYGFDSIAVALLAKSNPLAIVPAALLWGGLRSGAGLMQLRSGISMDLINVVQALVIVFVAADVIVRRLYRLKGKAEGGAVFTRGWGG